MKLILKQKLLSLLDSFDIYDESGSVVFTVKSRLALGHYMNVYDTLGNEVGTIKQELLHFLPTFQIYVNGLRMGSIKKEFTFFIPKFTLDMKGWTVEGDLLEWDYTVYDGRRAVMTVSKHVIAWTDTYELNIYDDKDTVTGLLVALAIDAEKCSRSN